jgi:hypothetical protein
MKHTLLTAMLSFFYLMGAASGCTIISSETLNASDVGTRFDGCTEIIIEGTLRMNADLDLTSLGPIIIRVIGGQILFSINSTLTLDLGSNIILTEGGEVTITGSGSGGCSAGKVIVLGTQRVAACIGGSGEYTFEQLNAAGSLSTLLPVELISFTSHRKNNYTFLTWKTATEINNEKFEIEISKDGVFFSYIGEVEGMGNSSIINSYQFCDDGIYTVDIVYYRLKQIDFDGDFEYSKMISVNVSITDNITVEYYNLIGQKIQHPTGTFIKVIKYDNTVVESKIIHSN